MDKATLTNVLRAVNAGGVVGVLIVGLWLGLRGDVVTADQLADCRSARDAYLREWIRAISPTIPTPIPFLPTPPVGTTVPSR